MNRPARIWVVLCEDGGLCPARGDYIVGWDNRDYVLKLAAEADLNCCCFDQPGVGNHVAAEYLLPPINTLTLPLTWSDRDGDY